MMNALPPSAVLPSLSFGSESEPGGESSRSAASVAREFESVLVAQMIKQMRQTISEEGMFPGDQADIYGGMFDSMMAKHLTAQGGFGLARYIEAARGVEESPLATESGAGEVAAPSEAG